MAKFHFIEDYERLISHLVATYPLDEAMERAVGGNYELIGKIQRDLLIHVGLQDGMSVIELGCGSGRLVNALGKAFKIEYCGIDIVQTLLDYARTKAPVNYKFMLNHLLKIPSEDASADIVCAFSVFTHLLPHEVYVYLRDIHRTLKPGGRVVFSFLEFANNDHWVAFQGSVDAAHSTAPHLNTLIERSVIELWREKLGYERVEFIDSAAAPWGGHPLGQSIAILERGKGAV